MPAITTPIALLADAFADIERLGERVAAIVLNDKDLRRFLVDAIHSFDNRTGTRLWGAQVSTGPLPEGAFFLRYEKKGKRFRRKFTFARLTARATSV